MRVTHNADTARGKHWSISVGWLDSWREMDVLPGDLLQGDLWLDPHRDQLRGVVHSIQRLENHYAWEIRFYGMEPRWRWSEHDTVPIIRTALIDGDAGA